MSHGPPKEPTIIRSHVSSTEALTFNPRTFYGFPMNKPETLTIIAAAFVGVIGFMRRPVKRGLTISRVIDRPAMELFENVKKPRFYFRYVGVQKKFGYLEFNELTGLPYDYLLGWRFAEFRRVEFDERFPVEGWFRYKMPKIPKESETCPTVKIYTKAGLAPGISMHLTYKFWPLEENKTKVEHSIEMIGPYIPIIMFKAVNFQIETRLDNLEAWSQGKRKFPDHVYLQHLKDMSESTVATQLAREAEMKAALQEEQYYATTHEDVEDSMDELEKFKPGIFLRTFRKLPFWPKKKY